MANLVLLMNFSLLVQSTVCATDVNPTIQPHSRTPGRRSTTAGYDPLNSSVTASTILYDALQTSSARMVASTTQPETSFTKQHATAIIDYEDGMISVGSHPRSTDHNTKVSVTVSTEAQTAYQAAQLGDNASEFESYDVSSLGVVPQDRNGTDPLWGWSWYPMIWPWYLILQTVSSIIGIIGNLLVMLVLFERRSACRSTDTLIGGLAVADFLTSLFIIPIPNEQFIPSSWLGEIYCRVVHSTFFLWVSVNASTYILMAISIERYIAVAHPLYFSHSLTRRRISAVIVFIWILAVASTAFGFFLEVVDDVTHTCAFRLLSRQANLIIGYYWFFVRMVIPMLTMLIPQTLIAIVLHRQSDRFKEQKSISTRRSRHLIARNRVLKMMFEVILIYIICWAPNQIAYLGYVLGLVPPAYLGSALHHSLTVLGFCNSCANPFIYTARHPLFRAAIMGMFTCQKGSKSPLFEPKMDSYTPRSAGNPNEGSTVKTV